MRATKTASHLSGYANCALLAPSNAGRHDLQQNSQPRTLFYLPSAARNAGTPAASKIPPAQPSRGYARSANDGDTCCKPQHGPPNGNDSQSFEGSKPATIATHTHEPHFPEVSTCALVSSKDPLTTLPRGKAHPARLSDRVFYFRIKHVHNQTRKAWTARPCRHRRRSSRLGRKDVAHSFVG